MRKKPFVSKTLKLEQFSVLRRKPSGKLVRCFNLATLSGLFASESDARAYIAAKVADGRGGDYRVTLMARTESVIE